MKKQLWGGEFWSKGYFVSTVGCWKNEEAIAKYIQEQGIQDEYEQLNIQENDTMSYSVSCCEVVDYKENLPVLKNVSFKINLMKL